MQCTKLQQPMAYLAAAHVFQDRQQQQQNQNQLHQPLKRKRSAPALEPSPDHTVNKITPEKKQRVTESKPSQSDDELEYFSFSDSDDDDSDDDAFWMDDRTLAASPKGVPLRQKTESKSAAAQEAELLTRQALKLQRKQAEEGWEDLDVEDDDDPLMVSEYVADIFVYLLSLEASLLIGESLV
jgi:hypothetical protein